MGKDEGGEYIIATNNHFSVLTDFLDIHFYLVISKHFSTYRVDMLSQGKGHLYWKIRGELKDGRTTIQKYNAVA